MGYIAVITREAAGRPYEVYFPDCPGCVALGRTLDKAIANAHDALAGWLEASADGGDELPAPATQGDIDRHMKRGAFITLVEAPPPPPKVEKVTISLASDLLRRIDEGAERAGMSRSSFMAQSSATAAASLSVGTPIAGAESGRKMKRARSTVTPKQAQARGDGLRDSASGKFGAAAKRSRRRKRI